MKRQPGIYKLTNTINNKVYVGQALNMSSRWAGHKRSFHNGTMCNPHLFAAITKYGIENFKFEIIEAIPDSPEVKTILNEREQFYIKDYQSMDPAKGYNKDSGGSRGLASEETKQKLKDTWKNGKRKTPVFTEESLKKRNDALLCANAARKGLPGPKFGPPSEETKQKISQANKGKPSWRKGVPLSAETKQKISQANKGKAPSRKGAVLSEETKQKMSQSHKNKIISDETREKMREAALLRWKNEEKI